MDLYATKIFTNQRPVTLFVPLTSLLFPTVQETFCANTTRNTYVTNAVVDGNVIRLKRLKRVSGAWKKASDDSIMNQKNTAAQAIKLTTRITDKALTEKYISLPAGYVMQSLPKTHATKSVMITEDLSLIHI